MDKPVPDRTALTFEVTAAGDEVDIHGDPAGLRLLASCVSLRHKLALRPSE